MKIGIVGNGMVGSAMAHLFPEALVYDIDPKKTSAKREEINLCGIVFICVPTDGNSVGYDYGPLEETISWVEAPIIVIKSTVQPGITELLTKKTGKIIVFNPEFLKEKTRLEDIENENRVIIGTNNKDAFADVKGAYLTKYDEKKVKIIMTSPKIAELVKIVNNAYLATKVTFCNEIKELADRLGIDYLQFRDIWLLDPRVGESHTEVTNEGGFGGHCLPKDLRALIKTYEDIDSESAFFKEVWDTNCKHRKEFQGKEYIRDKSNIK